MNEVVIVGDPKTFAIEGSILEAYSRPGLKALGYFVIHVGGSMFGINEPDATVLATAFDRVNERREWRGKHCMPQFDVDGKVRLIAFVNTDVPEDMFGTRDGQPCPKETDMHPSMIGQDEGVPSALWGQQHQAY